MIEKADILVEVAVRMNIHRGWSQHLRLRGGVVAIASLIKPLSCFVGEVAKDVQIIFE